MNKITLDEMERPAENFGPIRHAGANKVSTGLWVDPHLLDQAKAKARTERRFFSDVFEELLLKYLES